MEGFLRDLAERSRNVALKEYEALKTFAAQQGLEGAMQAWDVAYYSERLRQQQALGLQPASRND